MISQKKIKNYLEILTHYSKRTTQNSKLKNVPAAGLPERNRDKLLVRQVLTRIIARCIISCQNIHKIKCTGGRTRTGTDIVMSIGF
jgi:hypothetical protein